MAAQLTEPKRIKRNARKVDRQAAEAMYAGGMTTYEIAEKQGVNQSTISRYLASLSNEKDVIQRHRESLVNGELRIHGKATAVTDKILDSMDENYIARLNESQKNNALNALNNVRGTAFDKYRLESGQTSENVGILVAAISDLKRRKSVDNSQAITVDSDK